MIRVVMDPSLGDNPNIILIVIDALGAKNLGREYNRRLKKKFDQRNIEISFPHMTLYMGQNKQGEASPMRVLIQEKK